MNIRDLLRRLDRLEAGQGANRITGLCNLAGLSADAAANAIRDWRAWVADGRASRVGDILILRSPTMTAEEWAATHAPRFGALQ